MCIDIYIYTEIFWTFFQAIEKNEYTKRDKKWGSTIHLQHFHLFGEHY